MVNHYPKDWRMVLLSELSIEGFQNGLFYEVARKNKGIPIINVGDLYKSSPIANDKLELFNATAEEIKRYQVFNGDLFFTRSSIVPSGIAFCNWYRCSEKKAVVFDSHVVRFKTNTDVVNPMYLYLACIRPDARKYFLANAKTATMTTIDQTVLGRCPIPYPALKEQTAIAEAVSDADSLISSLQKLIEKKKAIKQGAMQELLTGQKRLPGFYKEWRIVQIGETLSIGHGQSQKTVENRLGKYPILATGGCIGYANDFLWDKPSVLIGRKGTIDKPQYADYPFWTIDTLFYTKIFDGYDAKFIYYKFCMIDWHQYNEASGVPSLNATTIENLQIIVPEKDEQQAIAQILSDMDSEIEQLEKKLAKYQQIKQGMMQELLTGRIRLV